MLDTKLGSKGETTELSLAVSISVRDEISGAQLEWL